MKLVWATFLAVVLALTGAVAVFAAQPSPHPHGKPSPTPSVQSLPTPSPSPEASPEARPSPKPSAQPSPEAGDNETSGGHPCNHGWYVSQAAHKHAGGAYVSSVARSDLGKNGSCTAPLPSPPG